jgi:hypothetical protein
VPHADASSSSADATRDAAIFADRSERKYFLRPDRAREFVDGLEGHVELHRFRGDGASQVPRPVHFITTLYFDTYDRQVAAGCRDGSANLKLRAREYYDEHPDLTELATSRGELARGDALIWLELKAKDEGRTRKIRFPMPVEEVAGFLAGGIVTQRAADMQSEVEGEDGEALLKGIWKLCRRVGSPLRPDSLVHYRRRAWQQPDGDLRVTLDTRVSFYGASHPFFRDFKTLRDKLVEPPNHKLDHFLVELKLRGEEPQWLRELAERVELRPATDQGRQFSKFLAASDAAKNSTIGAAANQMP